jgi:hypothetical protein
MIGWRQESAAFKEAADFICYRSCFYSLYTHIGCSINEARRVEMTKANHLSIHFQWRMLFAISFQTPNEKQTE